MLEAKASETEAVIDLVRQEMTHVMQLSVPLVVDVGFGQDWTAAH